MPQRHAKPGASTRPAFSAVELMIVILIIALLAAILIPVLSRAYKTALASADAALLSQIAMGCEAYNQVFHEYPNSTWRASFPMNPNINPDLQKQMGWPPPRFPSNAAPGYIRTVPMLSGAAKLYASLSGFNTLPDGTGRGCNSNPVGIWNPFDWQGACGELTQRGILTSTIPGGAVEDQPHGPYYVPNDKQQTATRAEWSGLTVTDQTVFASRFERENPGVPVAGGQETGAPILYYKAVQRPVDGSFDGTTNGRTDPWEIYDYRDNYLVTDSARSAAGNVPYFTASPITAFDGTWHPLYGSTTGQWDADSTINQGADFGLVRPVPGVTTVATGTPMGTTTLTPYNADTYVLISPGPDGLYFTADDVTNFKQ